MQTIQKIGVAALAAALLVAAPSTADSPSADFPFDKKTAEVLGSTMAYVDEGDGPVVVMLHGNPTSSYLWRNIIPHIADEYRVIAPDLIGMGDSGKPDIGYTYRDHATYLGALLTELELGEIVLVVHDWGSVLGMEIARKAEGTGRVRALAFMEAAIPPAFPAPSLDAMGPENAQLFETLRSPAGENMVLQNNFFVEEVLGKVGVVTPLSEDVMEAYRAPFPTAESRKPTLVWPRQIPIAGEPAETSAVVTANGDWLYSTAIPKLMLSVEPGTLMPAPVVAFVEANAANLTHIRLGAGVHFVQEDHPDAIGEALGTWLATLPQ